MDVAERPAWARRIVAERAARDMSQRGLARAMRMHAENPPEGKGRELDVENLRRRIIDWEKGRNSPDDYHMQLIARTFGTVTAAFFPEQEKQRRERELSKTHGQDTLNGSLTLSQHREAMVLAGWLALLVGCVEYDMGRSSAAERTRRAALSLATEAEHAEIAGWAHEMKSWFSLTTGDFRGVIAAARTGAEIAPSHSVAVQLAAQEAKAWARVGDRRQVELALDRGRQKLEGMPYPENVANHFVVDPSKFDFYAMDCYRLLGEDALAETYATEVLRAGTDFGGRDVSTMRNAEARITLGVVAARQGDLDQALTYGGRALDADRQSLPSLLMVSQELEAEVQAHFADDPDAIDYSQRLAELRAG